MIGLDRQLLVTLVDNGTALRARYVLVSGSRVLSEGECAPAELPRSAEARAAFFSRNGYFDRTEVEVRNARTLPFQARRIVEAALAFNEPFRVRYAAAETNSGRHRLDLAAAPDADIRAAQEALPLTRVPFTRLALAETSIAALVALETDEPVTVLWMRDSVVLGLLVQSGVVLARSVDRPMPGGEDDLMARVERIRNAMATAARRLFQDKDVTLTLPLGELLGTSDLGADAPSRAIGNRLARRFSGASSNAVLAWPEMFGLATVPACYSLLEPGYQEEAQASRYATLLGGALLVIGVAVGAAAFWQYLGWEVSQQSFQTRNAKLAADYAAIKQKLPSPEQLATLQQRNQMQAGLTDFRVDDFLSWVSRITPDGALVRRLSVTKGQAAPGAPAAQAAGKDLVMTIEWEVSGDYANVEKQTAGLLVRLNERSKLSDNKLEYKPGQNARFTTVLAPLPGAFR